MSALLGVGTQDAAGALRRGARTTTCWSSRTRTPPCRSVISGIVAGDRARRGARDGAQDPRGPPERGRRVPLRADGAGRRADPRGARPHRVPRPDRPGRRERHRRARDGRRTSSAQLVASATSSRRSDGRPGVQALAAAGANTFLEAGPGDVLTKLAKRVVPDATAVAVGIARGGRARARRLVIARHRRRSVACMAPARSDILGAVTRHATIAGVGSALPPAARAQQLVRDASSRPTTSGSATARASRPATSPTTTCRPPTSPSRPHAARSTSAGIAPEQLDMIVVRHDHRRHAVPGHRGVGAAQARGERARRST